ncbi:MAG: hypothetical protein ACREXS_01020, partial [Gammaproteobacteria bacterium]
HEGDKDVRFDTVLELMVDWTQLQIVFEVFERRLDLGKLEVELVNQKASAQCALSHRTYLTFPRKHPVV